MISDKEMVEDLKKSKEFNKLVKQNLNDFFVFLDKEKTKLNDGSILCYCDVSDYAKHRFSLQVGIKPKVKPVGEDSDGTTHDELNALYCKYKIIGNQITNKYTNEFNDLSLYFNMEEALVGKKDHDIMTFKPVFLVLFREFKLDLANKAIYMLIKAKDDYIKELNSMLKI